jgi:hypothetical protein
MVLPQLVNHCLKDILLTEHLPLEEPIKVILKHQPMVLRHPNTEAAMDKLQALDMRNLLRLDTDNPLLLDMVSQLQVDLKS